MQAETIIHHYNRLNGNSITRERLKQFHARVQSALDTNTHGSFTKDLRGILTRVTGVLKQNFDVIDRIELVPIDTNKHTGKVLRVASGYEEGKAESKPADESKPANVVAEALPLSKIHTDTKRFQNRMDAFSEASANSVAENYDPNKFDPIVIWKDPANKKLYVLSGHSRYEGMKRRKAKTIAARYFKGSEEQAIKFAKVEANRAAQLQDAIKAGRTPKVNLKAKMNATKKPAPLFDEPVNDPRQASLFGMKNKKAKGLHGIVSATSLAGLQFRTFELADPYKKEFHKLNSDTQAMIWGSPGHGKTVYMLKFAQYIAEKLGLKTLYIANEEFGRSTFTEKINEFKIGHPNLYFTKNLDESQVDQFDVIFFDSINSLGISLKDYKAFRDRHPGKLYVLIVQSTKDGDFRGGNDWEHEVDVAGEIRNRKIILHKNRFDKHNPEKMEKLLTTAAIEEAKKKAEIRQAVKQSQQPKEVTL